MVQANSLYYFKIIIFLIHVLKILWIFYVKKQEKVFKLTKNESRLKTEAVAWITLMKMYKNAYDDFPNFKRAINTNMTQGFSMSHYNVLMIILMFLNTEILSKLRITNSITNIFRYIYRYKDELDELNG